MASTETELRVLPVSTPLTFPFPVLSVRSVMLRLNPRLRLMPLPTTVMLMVDTPMLPVLTDTDTVWELPATMVDTWADTTVDTTDTPEFTHAARAYGYGYGLGASSYYGGHLGGYYGGHYGYAGIHPSHYGYAG